MPNQHNLAPAISSMSLGRAWHHSLIHKLDCAQANGIKGIELFFEDLEYFAREKIGHTASSEDLIEAASSVFTLCQARNLEIVCLQPFSGYEALKNRAEHDAMIEKAKLWFRIAKELKTDMVLVPATFRECEALIDSVDVIVADLQQLADLGAKCGIKFAYEVCRYARLSG